MSYFVYFGSNEVDNLLNAWASSDTWYTGHGDDIEIFYRLIRSYFVTQENPAFENFWPNCIKAVNRQQQLDSTSLEVALEHYQHEALIIFSYENANSTIKLLMRKCSEYEHPCNVRYRADGK